ncbi:MAG TPA: hypothetical protein VMN82_12770 [Thermoanaerobaculia bacterium]|nr:hypothetical protein [Thermoanaerobaculia bacterium]
MTRRRVAALAAGLLLLLVIASQPLSELPRRARTLAAFAPKELAVRRLGGSGTAFDRRFFSFLENARRRIPPQTAAVVLRGDVSQLHLYLATYYLAPLPVYPDAFSHQGELPRDWLIAAYGASPADDAGVFARLPEGALLAPPTR